MKKQHAIYWRDNISKKKLEQPQRNQKQTCLSCTHLNSRDLFAKRLRRAVRTTVDSEVSRKLRESLRRQKRKVAVKGTIGARERQNASGKSVAKMLTKTPRGSAGKTGSCHCSFEGTNGYQQTDLIIKHFPADQFLSGSCGPGYIFLWVLRVELDEQL